MSTEAAARWRNRIVGEGVVPAEQLMSMLNPKNFRTHGEEQAQAMRAVLSEVGWVQDVIVNRTTSHVIDGHLRIAQAAELGESVPVKWVELTQEEEDKVLATFDPISSLAGIDVAMFDALRATIETDDLMLRNLLDITTDGLLPDEAEEAEAGPEEQIPLGLQMQPFEHYDYVVLIFKNSLDFDQACDKFGLAQRSSPIGGGRYKIGLGRVVDGRRALALFGVEPAAEGGE